MSAFAASVRGLAAHARRSLARRAIARGLSGAVVAAVAIGVVVLAVPLPRRLTQPPSTVVAYADGSPAFVFLAPDDRYRLAVDLDAVDADYLRALLRFEDRRFYRHPGVDPLALGRALVSNLRAGAVVSGASTLTMQLVRVLEPRPRTLRSKVVEALRALQLEARLDKREILEAYLTFISFGRNLEGVTAASWSYFGHGPEELSAAEIATLLAVPQRPRARYPSSANAPRLRAARDGIATWLLAQEALSRRGGGVEVDAATLLAQVRATELPERLRPLPFEAPHLAFWLRARDPERRRFDTTLDRGAQRLLERQLRSERGDLARLGIHNGAAVVIDHRRGDVVALAGNLDFWDARHGGQIPGFAVTRSPGSALKPFLYGLAIDDGLALAERLVVDAPIRYGDYEPDNYDGEFVGLISLEEALAHSLNVPFVRLLSAVGMERFLDLLRRGGVAGLRGEQGFYGLSAVLGAVELSPLELAGLYAAVARDDGRYRAPRILRDPLTAGDDSGATNASGASAGERLLSPGSAHLVRRALARRDRPDFPERRRLSGVPPRAHWKTGTSYGHRDAWAVGSNETLTIAVWLGNFDRAPSFDLVGADAAGPILFDLLEALEDRRLERQALTRFPENLKTVEVCAFSGYLPGAACPTRKGVLAVRDRVPSERCPFHAAIDVDVATGLALLPGCRADRRYERQTFLVVPASVQRFLALEHKSMRQPPPFAPECVVQQPTRVAGREALTIQQPRVDQTVLLIPGLPAAAQEVPFEAEVTPADLELSWFVDGRLLASAPATERVWWLPEVGEHEVAVTDGRGRWARRTVTVRPPRDSQQAPLIATTTTSGAALR